MVMAVVVPYQTSIGHISASRGARGEVKKGKSSEFNQKNNEQVKSSPALKVWINGSSSGSRKMCFFWDGRGQNVVWGLY